MKNKITFIHTADIHLGSFLHVGGNITKKFENVFNNGVFKAFENIINAAIKYKVDFILIVGDLFDKEGRSITVDKFFVDQCKRINNIPIYIICGNHDPLISWKKIFDIPQNVFIFDSENVEKVKFNNNKEIIVKILGQSYRDKWESRKMYKAFNSKGNNIFNIGMLHTQLDYSNNNYVPCSLKDIKSKSDINYWALGHIHKCDILSYEPFIGYPGIPQGRDFGEEGLGGCFLVNIDSNNKIDIKYINTSSVIFKKINIFIDEDKQNIPKNITDIENMILCKGENLLKYAPKLSVDINIIEEELFNNFHGYIIKWILRGRGEIHKLFQDNEEDISSIIKEFLNNRLLDRTPFIYTDDVVIRTKKELENVELVKKNNKVFKDIEDFLTLCFKDENIKKNILKNFGQIWAENNLYNKKENRFVLNEETYKDILDQAKELIIEKLLKESE